MNEKIVNFYELKDGSVFRLAYGRDKELFMKINENRMDGSNALYLTGSFSYHVTVIYPHEKVIVEKLGVL